MHVDLLHGRVDDRRAPRYRRTDDVPSEDVEDQERREKQKIRKHDAGDAERKTRCGCDLQQERVEREERGIALTAGDE